MDAGKNIVERMLLKGDRIKQNYDDYDYSKLDKTQLFWLETLSLYSRYRHRVISHFNDRGVTTDMKVIFLDQNSMRIGPNLFYTVERSRQNYLRAVEMHPMLAFCAMAGFFIRYAIRTPLHKNLVRELGMSVGLGFGVTYVYPYYKYQQYISMVDQVYEIVTTEFGKRPKLLEQLKKSEDTNPAILKNFGFSQSNDNDIEDDEDGVQLNYENIFANGSEEELAHERKKFIMGKLGGTA